MNINNPGWKPPVFPEEFNLADYYLFDRLKQGLTDQTAICYGDLTYTYGSVADKALRLVAYFNSIGLSREQRVYLVLPDTPPFAWCFFATLAHGSVVAMGNPFAPPEDLIYTLDYVRAQVLITLPEVAMSLPGLQSNHFLKSLLLVPATKTGEDPENTVEIPNSLRDAPFEIRSVAEMISGYRASAGFERQLTRRDDPAIWLFTSGSTGRPKAAMHCHRDFAFNTEVYAKGTVGYQRSDRTVSVPRLFFGYSTGTNLMFPFAVGATACLYSEQPSPEALVRAIQDYQPTIVTNVPTMMSKLLDYDDSRADLGLPALDFSSIRFHLSAGEALPPALLKRFMDRFHNDVYDGIGSAEMFHIYASNRPGDIKSGSLGKAVNGYTIHILPTDAEGPVDQPQPPNETGIMWVKGDSVAMGYFQDRDKSWQTFHGYWCKTGDLFRMDPEGYLWFSGRADSLFKASGIWVAPLEVEECLQDHSAVSMAAVIPAESDGLKKPKAFVVLREGEAERARDVSSKSKLCSELQEHVKLRLSKHKYPRWIIFVDDLPRNDRGKINRKFLIDREKRGENPWE